MMHPTNSTTSIAVASLALLAMVSSARAESDAPVSVSPGNERLLTVVEHRCPAFSWGSEAEIQGWELVVYQLDHRDEQQGGLSQESRPVLTERLPGSARSWTPALGQCLEPGGQYAWSVRGTSKDATSSWSEPKLFEVAGAPTMAEVRDAMAVLSAYLGSESLEIRTGTETEKQTLPPTPTEEIPPPASSPDAFAASLGGSAAIRGVQTATSGDASGVVGETASAEGAGGVFGNTDGGPDLLLDGTADTDTDTTLSQSGLDRSSNTAETFDIGNSGSGDMTLTVDGIDVVTIDTDADTLGGLSCGDGQVAKWNLGTTQWICAPDLDTLFTAGNQLSLDVTQFNVVEGSGSGLDADTLDGLDSTDFLGTGTDNWVNVTGDTMTGTLALNPGGGNALETTGDIEMGTAAIRRSGAPFLHLGGGVSSTGVGQNSLLINTGNSNTAVGTNALRQNTTGSQNTALGDGAGYDNTEGGTNVAVGWLSLSNNTSGDGNVALGAQSLRHNTTANWNTGLGTSALYSNQTGGFNVAVGGGALGGNTTGSSNVAVGVNTLIDNQTGHQNTGVGNGALAANTGGGQNVAVGLEALNDNTTASFGTALGSRALFANTTGDRNTAVGGASLLLNTTGNRNTAVGIDALHYNSTGNYNVAVGNESLFNSTESGNTAVGDRALRESTSGQSNTATGALALFSNTTGSANTALGSQALTSNTIGSQSTAIGNRALYYADSYYSNTAVGANALYSMTSGYYNVALGFGALSSNQVGTDNIGVGHNAGMNADGFSNILLNNYGVASENNTLRIGRGTGTSYQQLDAAYIHGIFGKTSAGGSSVLINSAGKLGTTTSSKRFKEQIRSVDQFSNNLLALRPVQFRFTEEHAGPSPPLEFGLIAEEVAEVFPDLVIYDGGGNPFTVRYHLLAPLLLHEVQRQQEINATLTRRLEVLEGRVDGR